MEFRKEEIEFLKYAIALTLQALDNVKKLAWSDDIGDLNATIEAHLGEEYEEHVVFKGNSVDEFVAHNDVRVAYYKNWIENPNNMLACNDIAELDYFTSLLGYLYNCNTPFKPRVIRSTCKKLMLTLIPLINENNAKINQD